MTNTFIGHHRPFEIVSKLLDREELVYHIACNDAVKVLAKLRHLSREKYAFLKAHPQKPKWTVSKWPVRMPDDLFLFAPPDSPFPDWEGPAPSFEIMAGTELYLKLKD